MLREVSLSIHRRGIAMVVGVPHAVIELISRCVTAFSPTVSLFSLTRKHTTKEIFT